MDHRLNYSLVRLINLLQDLFLVKTSKNGTGWYTPRRMPRSIEPNPIPGLIRELITPEDLEGGTLLAPTLPDRKYLSLSCAGGERVSVIQQLCRIITKKAPYERRITALLVSIGSVTEAHAFRQNEAISPENFLTIACEHAGCDGGKRCAILRQKADKIQTRTDMGTQIWEKRQKNKGK